ncbi:hypothetical protein Cob_v009602 [Colletotrichum orbiculare MAFF 240422]|uniref:Uncharacterized protein n=1 Tax=Colletotrichum orbiculare (strain 104-T / ATCC 96160 / CBS 514.97 / LARS 414 / MAFF 240422) TaxID=1213857 RepID=A0A484FGF4_COLOR|nr:hypothetical protein Cob_v009602 [Colletotrichum orbiculare MAFF 240422]
MLFRRAAPLWRMRSRFMTAGEKGCFLRRLRGGTNVVSTDTDPSKEESSSKTSSADEPRCYTIEPPKAGRIRPAHESRAQG